MSSDNYYFVYMMTSNNNGPIYIGYTHDLAKRVYEHRNHLADGFTKKYNCINLVYYEPCPSKESALIREMQLKKWSRTKKNKLVNKQNPEWKDLSKELGIV